MSEINQKYVRSGRKTKIVATLGPASASYEQIKTLFKAGVDVFRLNFSHGSHDDHQGRVDIIRRIDWHRCRYARTEAACWQI